MTERAENDGEEPYAVTDEIPMDAVIACETCGGSRDHPRPLPYYADAICVDPWHPLSAFLAYERARNR